MRTIQDAMRHLERISVYLEVKGENPFKINAFRKAASILEASDADFMAIEDFTAMKGLVKERPLFLRSTGNGNEYGTDGTRTRSTGRTDRFTKDPRSWWEETC